MDEQTITLTDDEREVLDSAWADDNERPYSADWYITSTIAAVERILAARVAAARADERERVLGEVKREYRVMWWSEDHGKWYPHTLTNTDRPRVAEAWLEQASHGGPGGEPTETFIESRLVTPWTRDTSPAPTHADEEGEG